MISLSRQEIVQTAQTVVVKVGTNVLTAADGRLNSSRIGALADELVALRQGGKRVILVSSGAVGAGVGLLRLEQRPSDRPKLQAVAAIGQSKLMQTYEEALAAHGLYPAQVLLTSGDLIHRQRYLNVRNTFLSLLDYGVLPVVNENDTVSTDELTFGDNDRLASLIANLFLEPLLILLTDVDGLYDGDPALSGSRLISTVDAWSPSLMSMVAEKRSVRSKGGMSSKLIAARTVTSSGGVVMIANGDDPRILTKIFAAEDVGTVFFPSRRIPARKRWLGYAAAPKGTITIDAGAAEALLDRGKSLLPAGVVAVAGRFGHGDIVAVRVRDGDEIARGLVNYTSDEVGKILGLHCGEIKDVLGDCPYEEVIHRDNIQIYRL